MAVWVGDYILIKHKCGKRHFVSWRNNVCDLRDAELIGGNWWIGNANNICECGVNIERFNSKEWEEL